MVGTLDVEFGNSRSTEQGGNARFKKRNCFRVGIPFQGVQRKASRLVFPCILELAAKS